MDFDLPSLLQVRRRIVKLEPDRNEAANAIYIADKNYEQILRRILGEMKRKYPNLIDGLIYGARRTKWPSQKFDQDEILVRKAITELIEEAIAAKSKVVKPELDHIKKRLKALNNKTYDLTDRENEILRKLFEADGQWVQGKHLGLRPDKIINNMDKKKKPVRDLIESNHQSGYRIPSLL